MTLTETKKYLKQRLKQLGWAGIPGITRGAAEMIYGYTGGIQEEIDQLCDKLPLAGEQGNNSQITRYTVKAVIRELNLVEQSGKQGGMSANEILSIDQLALELESKMRAAEIPGGEDSAAILTDQAETLSSESKKPIAVDQGTAVSQGKPKILVVDDSTTVRAVIHTALQNDFVCIEAKDGEEGWNTLLSDTEIVIAIVDLEMPALDGFGLIRRIKTSHISRIAATPVLVVTAKEDTIAKKEAYMAGANDFLTKSTDPFELLVRVRTHCTLSQAKSELAKRQSPTGRWSDDLDVPTLNDQPSVTSELSEVEADAASKNMEADAASKNMEADAASKNMENNSRRRVGRWFSKSFRRIQMIRAQPTVAMTLVATLLAVVIVVFAVYEPTQPAGTSESIELASAETMTQEEQAVNKQQGRDQSEQVPPNTDLPTKTVSTSRKSVIASQIKKALGKPVMVAERSLKTEAGRKDSLSKTASETAKVQQPSSRTELSQREVTAEVKAETLPSVPVPQLTQSRLSVALQSGPPVQAGGQKERPVATAQKTESKVTPQPSSSPREAAQSPKTVVSVAAPRLPDTQQRATQSPAKKQENTSVLRQKTRKDESSAQGAPSASKNVVAYATPALREVTPPLQRSFPPQGDKQVASPDSAETLPATNIASASPGAAAEQRMPDKITVGELSAMLRTFIAGYETGDLNRFMGLFAEEARTNERKNRAQIRKDYENLFLSTDMRRMVLQDLSWELKGNRALGWGNFDVKVQSKGEQNVKTYSGSLAFQIERRGQAIRITRLYHSQNRVKASE